MVIFPDNASSRFKNSPNLLALEKSAKRKICVAPHHSVTASRLLIDRDSNEENWKSAMSRMAVFSFASMHLCLVATRDNFNKRIYYLFVEFILWSSSFFTTVVQFKPVEPTPFWWIERSHSRCTISQHTCLESHRSLLSIYQRVGRNLVAAWGICFCFVLYLVSATIRIWRKLIMLWWCIILEVYSFNNLASGEAFHREHTWYMYSRLCVSVLEFGGRRASMEALMDVTFQSLLLKQMRKYCRHYVTSMNSQGKKCFHPRKKCKNAISNIIQVGVMPGALSFASRSTQKERVLQ